MPWRGMSRGRDGRLKGELGEDGQLVGGVGAVDVEASGRPRRSRAPAPGPARRRRPGPRRVIFVRMKLQVPLTIAARFCTWLAASATPRAWMIGNAAADARLERHGAAGGAGLREDPRAVLGQQCLVGRHHVLAGGQAVEHDAQGRFDPAHGFHHDVDFRIVDQPAGSVVIRTPSSLTSGPGGIADRPPTSSEPRFPARGRCGRRARSRSGRRPFPRFPARSIQW